MDFSEEQFHRYARHLILDEVGEEGQKRLLESKVLVVGAGGLGAPALLYLAAAGIGCLGIVDDDEVDLTNLQRQVIHNTKRLGIKKTDSAMQTIAELNPGIEVNSHNLRLNNQNAAKLVEKYNDLAREALSNGDKILSENYFQYADHFLRVSLEQKEKDTSQKN